MLNNIIAVKAVSINWSPGTFGILRQGSIHEWEYVDQAETPTPKTPRISRNFRTTASKYLRPREDPAYKGKKEVCVSGAGITPAIRVTDHNKQAPLAWLKFGEKNRTEGLEQRTA
ncbi:hypothetical protein FVER53590_26533 [Fusarium verticillioides]|nr:hypothetical protein FVER53590_26533 [Fusarium verticillioides]